MRMNDLWMRISSSLIFSFLVLKMACAISWGVISRSSLLIVSMSTQILMTIWEPEQ